MDINDMDYSRFVSLLDERNRCSGGIRTVTEVIVNSRMSPASKVLEVGSNTGFTSVNLSLLSGCSVVGVDINEASVKKAIEYAQRQGVSHRVRFLRGSATALPFAQGTFDYVWASNVTSFIDEKNKAFDEYLNALRVGGTLSVTPIYYIKQPPAELVGNVENAIGARLDVVTKDGWKRMVEKRVGNLGMELYYEADYVYNDIMSSIPGFIDMQLSKPHIRVLPSEELSKIMRRAEYFYMLFNENLKYCGFSTFLYQKRMMVDERELFTSQKVD